MDALILMKKIPMEVGWKINQKQKTFQRSQSYPPAIGSIDSLPLGESPDKVDPPGGMCMLALLERVLPTPRAG